MRAAPKIELDAEVERELLSLTRKGRVEARTQQRARIVLLAAKGWQNKDIAAEVGLNRLQVALWRGRFLEGGIDALKQDAPRCGRPVSSVTAEVESLILAKTLHDKPISATHWSTRTLAAQLGLGPTSIRRVWSRNGLKPHRQTRHLELHLIVDNYGTHKHPQVQAWLARHPRFVMHFTPTSASWLNMVERFFRGISENRIRRDSFASVAELELAIDLYVLHHNANPKPFIWTATASDILAKVTRAKAALARASK